MVTPATFTTRQSDMWDLISYLVYGTEYEVDKLIDANPTYYDVAVFDAGIVLTIPPLTPTIFPDNPPWVLVTN